jgi:hypothetical protein
MLWSFFVITPVADSRVLVHTAVLRFRVHLTLLLLLLSLLLLLLSSLFYWLLQPTCGF